MTQPSIPARTLADAAGTLCSRVASTLDAVGGEFPYVADPDTGEWRTIPDGNWCAGHWIGLLRLAREYADSPETRDRYEAAAAASTETFREAMPPDQIFYGMNCYYAGFRGYDLTGDRELFGLGLAGADSMRRLFDEAGRVVPLGEYQVEGPKGQFAPQEVSDRPPRTRTTATDVIYAALPVLWRAYAETRDPSFLDVALAHANSHLDLCLRDDGSTWHKVAFDPASGEATAWYNDLAASAETCWARGHAWNVAGLAYAYEATSAERFLAALERSMDYYEAYTPDDLVPYWDFRAPEIPDAPRDTSAAAITAYGLTRLDPNGRTAALRTLGEELLASILEHYLVTEEGPRRGTILHGCFNKPGEYATDDELLWSAYYVFESVHRLLSG